MVKYEIFTNVNTAKVTEPCFIIITYQQLNNTAWRLMSKLGANSSNKIQIQKVVDYLSKIDNCCDKSSHRCLKPDTKIVTTCSNELFAYFQAVLDHYKYIFDHCTNKLENETTEHLKGYLNLLKDSSTSVSSNYCLTDLHSGSHSDNFRTNSSTQTSYNASTPHPSSSLMPPAQTVMGYDLSSNVGVTSTVASVVTEDNIGNGATNKSALFGSVSTDDPHHSDGNLTQTEFSNSGTVPNTPSTSSSAASHSQIVSAPIVEAGTANPYEDKWHTNSQNYLYPFIGTLGVLVLVVCATLFYGSKMRVKKQRYRRDVHRDSEVDISKSFLESEV
ncbi:uncharacterized protein [Heptranchias perlo]|uniref:uncharacterized protein n=1 Tax=Heptranchias perlo TaxID=212740 RepID=UPI0035597A08